MPKNPKTLESGGSKKEHRGKTHSYNAGGMRKSRMVRGSTISERVIERTSVKRRAAMKALADR